MSHLRRVLALAAIVATGCGGSAATLEGTPSTANSTPPSVAAATPTVPAAGDGSTPTTPAPAVSSVVPDLAVVEVSSGRTVALRSVPASDRPTLIWMWAPH